MKPIIYIIFLGLFYQSFAQNTEIFPEKLNFARRTYSEILLIPSPQKGSTCYDTDNNCLRVYNGTFWECTKTTSGFDDATGCCSGAVKVTSTGGITGNIPYFNESTVYNNEFYQVGDSPGGGTGYGYSYGAGGFTTFGNIAGYVAKYDQSGTNLWVRAFGNSSLPSSTVNITSVKADASGVYVIGSFNSVITVTVGGTPTTFTNVGNFDMFVAQLNATTGDVNWFKQFGGTGEDRGVDLVIGDANNLYFTGYENGGMTVGYCVPNTGARDVFVGKLDKTTGNSLTNGGIINEPISNTETVKNILFYDNKVLLVGTFQGQNIYASYVMAACAGILGSTTLTPTFGREVYILGYDTALLPISTYKYSLYGDSAGDQLNLLNARIESGFVGGSFSTKLKVCSNIIGTFPLGSTIVTGTGLIATLTLNGSSLPTLGNVITVQGATFTAFNYGYAAGTCTAASSGVNGSATFGGAVGKNFMLSTSPSGLFKWVITSNILPPDAGTVFMTSYQSTTTITKVCKNVFGAGLYNGKIQLCSSTLNSGNRIHGYFWKYSDDCGCD